MRLKSTIISLLFGLIGSYSFAQTHQLNPINSELIIEGTSTIHDWEIDAQKLEGKANIEHTNNKITINFLSFKVTVNELKSGKSSMDANTKKALNEEDFKYITYQLQSIESQTLNKDQTIVLDVIGKLTIAGKTNMHKMQVIASIINDKITFKGNTKLDMTSFNIPPPTAVMGTIKTGKDITIKFVVNYVK